MVVRETVLALAGIPVIAETELWVCADATLIAPQTRMARDRFFTVFSIWGRLRID